MTRLQETDLKQRISNLADILNQNRSFVFFGGAGVSTESGIPDFRSSQGLYQKPNTYAYPPEYLLSHTCFINHPQDFFRYYFREMIHPDAKPNDAHIALAKLEQAGKCKAVITQNIDGLHQMAGSQTVCELHGSIHRNTCQSCGKHYPLKDLLAQRQTSLDPDNFIPRCHCHGIIKPDVILYEEPLAEDTIRQAIEAIADTEVLIVGGTSLRVYPAAGFLRYFKGRHLILMNREATSYDTEAELIFREPIGLVMAAVMKQLTSAK